MRTKETNLKYPQKIQQGQKFKNCSKPNLQWRRNGPSWTILLQTSSFWKRATIHSTCRKKNKNSSSSTGVFHARHHFVVRGYRGMIIWWGLPTPLKNLVKVSWGYEIPNFSWKVSENSMVFHGSSHHQPVIFVSFKDHRSIYKQRNTNRTRPEPQEASYVRVSVQKRPSQLWCMTQVYIYI